MKKLINLMVVLFAISACSTHKARINYNDFRDSGVAMKSGSWDGQDMGRISGEDGGAVWDNCTEKARGSVEELIDQAKDAGANAVGDIKWHASNSAEPRCKKGWGYTLLWPFLLTPLFMSTKVEGTAYKVKKVSKGMMMLPTTEEEKEAFITALVSGQ
ncbi:MAG: hypothetical protein HRT44_03060 [Bdellovibrionales bacterium]|nr:hypothetical protein [Bdellovibrionales bacterium]NQZ18226.1 hypothetical protein [Bdellovibrionales bacterium]